MPQTRAKFRCIGVEKIETWVDGKKAFAYNARMSAVSGGPNESPENKMFFGSTPSGTITLSTIRNDVFEVGSEYYVDFTECAVAVAP